MTLRELLGSMLESIESEADLATFRKFVGFVQGKEHLDEVLLADEDSDEMPDDESEPSEACQIRTHFVNVILESTQSIAAAEHLRFLARRIMDLTDTAKATWDMQRVEDLYRMRYEKLIQRLNEAVDGLVELEKAELAVELRNSASSIP